MRYITLGFEFIAQTCTMYRSLVVISLQDALICEHLAFFRRLERMLRC